MKPGPMSLWLDPRTPLLARELGDAVVVGSSFVLIRAGVAGLPAVRELSEPLGLIAVEDAPRVVCLWGRGEVSLPGAVVAARQLPRWQPVALWMSSPVSVPGRPLHVLLMCPGLGVSSATLTLTCQGHEARTQVVALEGRGLGHATWRDLPSGIWTVAITAPESLAVHAAPRSVLVSSVSPPAFTARWLDRRHSPTPSGRGEEGGRWSLHFSVRLTLHGHPLSGQVRLALRHRRQGTLRRLPERLSVDPFGTVRSVIEQPEGDWALCFIAEALDGQMTRLELPPLPSDEGRLELGPMTFRGGLVSGADSQGYLGLRYVPGASLGGAALSVEPRPAGRSLTLLAHEAITGLSVLTLEPLGRRATLHELGSLEVGQRASVPIEDPLGLVVGAGFSGEGEVPWESWGGWLGQPNTGGVSMAWCEGVQERDGGPWAASGTRPSLTLALGDEGGGEGQDAEGVVLLLIGHERSPWPHRRHGQADPFEPLGERLWQALKVLTEAIDEGDGLRPLYEAAGGHRALEEVIRRLRGGEASSSSGQSPPPPLEAPWLDVTPVSAQKWELLDVRLVTLSGRETVRLPSVPSSGCVRVEALCVRGARWSRAEARLSVGPFAQLSVAMPPFVDPGDHVLGRVEVITWRGPTRLSVVWNGEAVPMTLHPQRSMRSSATLSPDHALPAEVSVSFELKPGVWTVRLEGPEGESPQVVCAAVSQAGRLRTRRSVWRPLFEGEAALEAASVGARDTLQVMETPARALEGMIHAVLGAPWRTCESHAAALVAATVSHLRGWRTEAELMVTFAESARALETLFVPGRGFALATPGGAIDPVISDMAVRHILRLEELGEALVAARVRSALAKVSRLARRSAMASEVVLPPRPEGLRDGDDADLFRRFRPERLSLALATARSRLKRRASRRDREVRRVEREAVRSEVVRRRDQAYAARVLLHSDDALDRRMALEALSAVISAPRRVFLAEGGLTGTADTVAAIFALHTMLAHLSSKPARVSVDDEERLVTRVGVSPVGRVRVLEGVAWVRWDTWCEDDLSDPAASMPFQVSLHHPGGRHPEVHFGLGQLIELRVDLGEPGQGGGARFGDWLAIHLPEALLPVELPAGAAAVKSRATLAGRRLWIALAGRHRLTVKLRAVSVTSGHGGGSGAQHLAAGVCNIYDASRGRGMLGLSVTVASRGKGLTRALKRLFG